LKIIIDAYSDIQPLLIWKRYKITNANRKVPIPFAYTLPFGFSYFLETIVSKNSEQMQDIGRFGIAMFDTFIEFTRQARNRKLQSEPTPLSLISSPIGIDHVSYFPPPAPVDQSALGVSSKSVILTEPIELDYLYIYRETINYDLSFKCDIDLAYDLYCDVVLNGYLIPDSKIAAWGLKNGTCND
jgi:hypothetical protein